MFEKYNAGLSFFCFAFFLNEMTFSFIRCASRRHDDYSITYSAEYIEVGKEMTGTLRNIRESPGVDYPSFPQSLKIPGKRSLLSKKKKPSS